MGWDAQLAQFSEDYWNDYQRDVLPLQQQLIQEYQNYSTVDQSVKDALKARAILGQAADRNMQRTGAYLTQQQRGANAHRRVLGDALAQVNANNSARFADIDTKNQMLPGIIEQGNALRSNAISGLGSASQMEASRIQAYNQMKSQTRGIGMGLAGAAAGALVGLVSGGNL